MKKFFDTSSLIKLQNRIFNLDDGFAISIVSISELENIKTSRYKDDEIKYAARNIVRLLDKNYGDYGISVYGEEEAIEAGLELSNDSIILGAALNYQKQSGEKIEFCTDDLTMKTFAKTLGLNVISSSDIYSVDNYTGFKEIYLTDEQTAYFYEHLDENQFNCLINQYIIIHDNDKTDVRKWNGEKYIDIYNRQIKSIPFDKIKPKDDFQKMAIDSIMTNTMTAISGIAGTGKTLLSLTCAMNLIETGKYDRIIMLTNPTKARGASDCGFYSGNSMDKLMQNSIGNILTSKFGDVSIVNSLIYQEKLKIISMADQRGMEVKNNEILIISECQNTSVDLLKLCLSRVSHEAKVIIEGDPTSQVDSRAFENGNNGMNRAIEVFKGEDCFGYVELQNVHRGKIAELVSKM